MKLYTTTFILSIFLSFALPAILGDGRVEGEVLPYDTIQLNNGSTIYGKARPHPVRKGSTEITFSNGGTMVLKNSEIEYILPNTSAKDQFERGGLPEG
jgi:hypothetical protein